LTRKIIDASLRNRDQWLTRKEKMKRILLDTVLIFILSVIVFGCQKKEVHTKYENIVHIYFSSSDKWYHLTQENNLYQKRRIIIYGGDDYAQLKIIDDIQQNQKMWAYLIENPREFSDKEIYLEIHVHNKKDIDTRQP
jgi:hypothetical protein